LLKSRAGENYILYNRLTGESTGTESYEIDLPNGGKSYVIGNLIEQGPNTDNPTLLAYRQEGANPANPSDALFVVNNTFVNDKGSGTFVNIQAAVGTPAILTNNVFFGGGTITNQASAVQANNYSGNAPLFVNLAGYDYQPMTGSPLVDAGIDPGSGGGMSLVPTSQYVHPASGEGRTSAGTIDIGAYELGGGTGTGGSAGSGSGGTAGSGSGGSANGGTANGGSGGASSGGTSSGGTGTGATGSGGTKAGGESDDDGGCGCRVPARAPTEGGIAVALALGLAFLRRRR
jgi:MYXO-CTERM domain-containing protein